MRKTIEFKSPFLDKVEKQYELIYFHDTGRIGLVIFQDTIDKKYRENTHLLKLMLASQCKKVIFENGRTVHGNEYHLYQFT